MAGALARSKFRRRWMIVAVLSIGLLLGGSGSTAVGAAQTGVEAITPATAAHLEQVARWGTGLPTASAPVPTGRGIQGTLAYAPDGRRVALATSTGVYLFDAATLVEIRALTEPGPVRSVTFSPDGQVVAAGLTDGAVHLWDVADGALLRSLKAESAPRYMPAEGLAFTPDGRTLAAALGKETNLWRVSDGALLGTLAIASLGAFTPDGRALAASGPKGELGLWNIEDGVPLHTLTRRRAGDLLSSAISPDRKVLVTSSSEHYLQAWRLADGALLWADGGPGDQMPSVAFAADGQTLASGSYRGIVLRRTSDGMALRTLAGHARRIGDLAFAPDAQRLTSVSEDQTVRVWGVADGSSLGMLGEYTNWAHSMAFAPDGQTLASGWDDGTVRVHQAADGWLPEPPLVGHTTAVSSLAYTPDGQILASGSLDGDVRLWRFADRALLRTLVHPSQVLGIAIAPDGETLASAGQDGNVRMWRLADGVLLRTLAGHTDWVRAVAFAPNRTDRGFGLVRRHSPALGGGGWGAAAHARGADRPSLEHGLLARRADAGDRGLCCADQAVANGRRRTAHDDRELVRRGGGPRVRPGGSSLASIAGWDLKLWRVADGSALWEGEGHGNRTPEHRLRARWTDAGVKLGRPHDSAVGRALSLASSRPRPASRLDPERLPLESRQSAAEPQPKRGHYVPRSEEDSSHGPRRTPEPGCSPGRRPRRCPIRRRPGRA